MMGFENLKMLYDNAVANRRPGMITEVKKEIIAKLETALKQEILKMTWALGGLTATQKLVLLAIVDSCNYKLVASPSIADLEKKTCLGRSAIKRSLAELNKVNILDTKGRSGDNKENLSNEYVLQIEQWPERIKKTYSGKN